MPPSSLLMPGQAFIPGPLLTRAWEGAVAGWIVVIGAAVAELIAGLVTRHMPTAIVAAALAFPVALAWGFAIVQWWQVRSSSGAEPASWWHLGGIAAALLIWRIFPTVPFALRLGPVSTGSEACFFLQAHLSTGCVYAADQALRTHMLVWWLTGGLILGAALLIRWSRIAAWTVIPTALAGCMLAYHFLEALALRY